MKSGGTTGRHPITHRGGNRDNQSREQPSQHAWQRSVHTGHADNNRKPLDIFNTIEQTPKTGDPHIKYWKRIQMEVLKGSQCLAGDRNVRAASGNDGNLGLFRRGTFPIEKSGR